MKKGDYIFKITSEEDYELVKEFAKKILSKYRYSWSVFIHNDWYENNKNKAIRLSSTYDDMGFSNWEYYQSDYTEYTMVDNVKEFFENMEKEKNMETENEEEEVKDDKIEENKDEEEDRGELLGRCMGCNKAIYKDDDYDSDDNDNYVCEDCRDDYVHCDDCGTLIHCDDSYSVYNRNGYDVYVCADCLDDNYFCCDDCGNYEHIDNEYTTYDNHSICSSCREDHYYCCDDCGYLVYEDDYYCNEDDDCIYCPHCWPDHERDSGEITGYHDHDRWNIPYYNDYDNSVNKDNFEGGYGFELEVDDGDDRCDCSNELYDLLGDHAIYETDGSLSDDGFEIITRPMTRRAMESMPLDKMVEILRSYNFKSHDSGCCGLHVHVSRKLFGDDEVQRTENIAKMILFYEIFWDDLVKVSRRKSFGYCNKMSDDNSEPIDDFDKAKKWTGEGYGHSRYCCVNLCNSDTVEFRLMRGTLKLSTLRATLDFTMTLVENVKNVPIDKITDKDLWLAGLKPETIEYLKERRAFGYEPDDEENE